MRRHAIEMCSKRVMLVKDATAAFRCELLYAADELNRPTYARSIINARELVEALAKA